jgi:hypothetical protein
LRGVGVCKRAQVTYLGDNGVGLSEKDSDDMGVNEGWLDRTLRIILGLVLIGLAVTGYWAPWGWIGIVPLITGIVGFCGLYQVLGIKTCPIKSRAR